MTNKDRWVVAVHKDSQLMPVAVCHEDDVTAVAEAFSNFGKVIKWRVQVVESKETGQ